MGFWAHSGDPHLGVPPEQGSGPGTPIPWDPGDGVSHEDAASAAGDAALGWCIGRMHHPNELLG